MLYYDTSNYRKLDGDITKNFVPSNLCQNGFDWKYSLDVIIKN